ncbi:hypothetical protein DBR11_06265 [Pedobacter sp. HMWF019]|nr:helix-turn-helix transcriptional regulator [Pedobacter sp. HMWF019]PTT01896.1 hypothetical protein DBR11_06265 [Pedobacter sp. HMWF019]
MKTISKNIKFLRQKMGWRQREVAELLKISIPAYSKILCLEVSEERRS